MRDLGLDLARISGLFVGNGGSPFAIIEVAPEWAGVWSELLEVPIRRCYIADEKVQRSASRLGIATSEVVRSTLPDRGSVMAGDFGEILTAIYQAASLQPANVLDPKKWRLKQDRNQPAPHSDVVQFLVPEWPTATSADKLICSEVKTKSTSGASTPVTSAIADARKDREGRLAKTLVWLRDRARLDDLGTVTIPHLNRFIEATDHPRAVHEFRAVAVISSELVSQELRDVAPPPADECTLVVISIPDLKANYEAVFHAIVARADEIGPGA